MYGSLADETIRNSHLNGYQWRPDGNAEIVVYYEENQYLMNSDDITRTDIKFSLASSIHLNLSDANSALHLENIECVSIDKQDAASHVEGATVTFHKTTPDGDLLVTRDDAGNHRLIVYSCDGCTTLSSELHPEFFKQTGQGSVFSAPADVIQLQNRGVRKIMRYKEGFQANNFCNADSAKMIELARKTIAASLPIRTINMS